MKKHHDTFVAEIKALTEKVERSDQAIDNYKERLGMLAGCNIERNIYCDLAVVFASATSFDAAFKQTVAILSQHLKARYCGIFWLAPGSDSFEYRHGKGYVEKTMPPISRFAGLMGQCAEQARVVWESDTRKNAKFIALDQNPPEHNLLCAPVTILGKVAGVVRLANLEPSTASLGEKALATVAPMLSGCLERLLLAEQNDKNKRGIEISFAIAKLLENTLDEQDILKRFCAEVPRMIPCAGCVVGIPQADGSLLPVSSFPDGFIPGGSTGSATIYYANLIQGFPGGHALIPSIFVDKRWSWQTKQIKSLVMVPLKMRGSQRGTVIAFSPADQPYDRTAATLLELAATQASFTLERAAYFKQQEDLARKDGLTGLFNHRVFQEVIREEIDRCKRYRRPLSLIMLDIDHFKKFNDTYGHPVGDQVIKVIAGKFISLIRTTDRAFRYGGEEFVVLLPETSREGAALSAERIRSAVAAERSVNNLTITISLGGAFLQDSDSAETLIARADEALYRAKEQGRNRFCWSRDIARG